MTQPILTPEQHAEILAYNQPAYALSAVSELIDVIIIVVMLRFWVRPFYRAAEAHAAALARRGERLARAPVFRAGVVLMGKLWNGPGWGTALLFSTYIFLALNLLFLPQGIFFGYIHEHRFGLSTYTPARFAFDAVLDLILRLGVRVALVIGMYGLMRRVKRWWALTGAVCGVLMLFSGLIDPYRNVSSPFRMTSLPQGPLRDRIVAVMAQAQVTFSDIKVLHSSRATRKVQAYFTGQGPSRTIVLTDTLVETFPEEEVEVAVAHEAGHIQENKMLPQVAAALTLFAYLFCIDRLFRLVARRGWFGVTHFTDIRTLPLLTVTLYVLMGLGSPIAGAVSREREREADRFAIALTHKPEAFQALLIRIARTNKIDPSPPPWIVFKGATHPAITERLEAAERAK